MNDSWISVDERLNQPVLWVESENNIRDKGVRYAINSVCNTVMYHIEKPDTDNPVWPLYAENTQTWIDCNDRLPNDYARVMVLKDCGLNTLPSHAIAYLENSVWIADLGAGNLKDWGYRVTHWQPLPEPPKE